MSAANPHGSSHRGLRPTLGWVVGLVILCGCGRTDPLEKQLLECASLPGATKSTNEKLVRHVAILRQQGATPDAWPMLPIAPDTNAAVALNKSLSERLTPRIADKIKQYFYDDLWLDDPETIASIVSFLDFHTIMIDELDRAVAKKYCQFNCRHEYGFFASLDFLEYTTFAVRVELLRAMDAGRDGDTAKAGRAISQSLQWCRWLSEEPRVEPRLQAAELRRQTLDTAGLLFVGGWLGREEAKNLFNQLRVDLVDWPNDAKSLAGDRSVTMHTYETLRLGMLDSVITGLETSLLDEEGRLEQLQTATPEQLDQDELNYLEAMHDLIAASEDTPLYLRLEAIKAARERAAQEPDLFANRIFLDEIPEILNFMARDRALCEAWLLVCAQSLGYELPPYRLSPFNGKEYQETHEEGIIWISLNDKGAIDPACPDF